MYMWCGLFVDVHEWKVVSEGCLDQVWTVSELALADSGSTWHEEGPALQICRSAKIPSERLMLYILSPASDGSHVHISTVPFPPNQPPTTTTPYYVRLCSPLHAIYEEALLEPSPPLAQGRQAQQRRQ